MMTKSRVALMAVAALVFLGAPHAIGGGDIAESANDIQPVGTGDKMPAATVRAIPRWKVSLTLSVLGNRSFCNGPSLPPRSRLPARPAAARTGAVRCAASWCRTVPHGATLRGSSGLRPCP